jgi:hypothetical protein
MARLMHAVLLSKTQAQRVVLSRAREMTNGTGEGQAWRTVATGL